MKKYIVQCKKCGESVERCSNMSGAVCFDCKTKKQNDYNKTYYKPKGMTQEEWSNWSIQQQRNKLLLG